MTTLVILGLAALAVVVVSFVVLVATRLVFQFMKRPLEDRIAAYYQPEEIIMMDLTANSFGLESAGAWQLRGNGALVLTARCLHFFMFVPKREFRVPLNDITEVTYTKSHLGKATVHDLLKVRFRGEDKPDSIALYLNDPTEWKNRIEELMTGSASNKRQ